MILRVAGIYGPDRGHWFKQFLQDEARIEGDGSRFLNMIHRDDLIGVIIAALESGQPGEIYNAVDDEPVSQLDFFEWLRGGIETAAAAVAFRRMRKFVRKRGVTNKRVSNAKLRTELKFKFQFPRFPRGLCGGNRAAQMKDGGLEI